MTGILISKPNAKKLIENLFSKADPTQHRFKPAFLKHADATCEIARKTATDIISRHPELKIDSEMVTIAAYLHDIGRLLNVEQRFHEIRGALYIRDIGCEVGITADKNDLERLSEMIISHFIVYEEFSDGDYILRREFPGITPLFLLPKTIEQQIIV
ncbi:MAG: HD domain-containing protein, partial [Candidatus Altiarchaeota archaeon]|nr:HD domain-containing protein [Candidatus Altiarchaeota archaeon]